MTKGFDYKKRRDWPARGAKREWPPLNPQETDPSLIMNQIISGGVGTLGSTTYICLRQLNVTVPNNTTVQIHSTDLSVFGGVISNDYPESAWLDGTTNTFRFPKDGPYAMIVRTLWDSNTTGTRITSIIAGQFATGTTEEASVNLEGTVSSMGFETGGDNGNVQLFQDSGANRDAGVYMFIAYVGGGSGGGGGGTTVITGADQDLGHSLASVGAGGPYDDEFTGTSIDAAWTDVFRGGASPGSWVQRYNRMNYRHTAAATLGDMQGLVRAKTMSVGDYIETGMHTAVRQNYSAAGLILTDSSTFGAAGIVALVWFNSNGFCIYRGETATTWAASGATDQTTLNLPYTTGPLYMRLKYEAANTFGTYFSGNGFEWHPIQQNIAKTMTPTYVGLVVWHYQGLAAPAQWAEWDYFRYNPANE